MYSRFIYIIINNLIITSSMKASDSPVKQSTHKINMSTAIQSQQVDNLTANLSTRQLSLTKKDDNNTYQESSLSKIIGNYENLWIKTIQQCSGEMEGHPYLLLDSYMSVHYHGNQEIGENILLSEKDEPKDNSKSGGNLQIQSAKSSASLGVKSLQQELKSGCKAPEQKIMNHPQVSLVTPNFQNSFQFKSCSEQMNAIQQIALLGYWCCIFLDGTPVRWLLICTLMYKQGFQKLKKFAHLPLEQPKLRDQREAIQKGSTNLLHMIELCKQISGVPVQIIDVLESKSPTNICPLIVEYSRNFVSDIMQLEASNKGYQFCLYKMLRAINLVCKLNGMNILEQEDAQAQIFCIGALKKSLIKYKLLIKEFLGGE